MTQDGQQQDTDRSCQIQDMPPEELSPWPVQASQPPGKIQRMHIHRPFWAAVMSLMQIGWGQFYNGQIAKAVWIYIIAQVLSVVVVLIAAKTGHPIVIACFVAPLYAFALIEAVITARAMGPFHKKWIPAWYWHLVFVVLASLLDFGGYLAVSNTVLKYSKIPSTSMLPTLTVMDVVVVDRTAYLSNPVQRGDIVVFKPKQDSNEEWIKRVVGIGKDMVRYDSTEGILWINDEPVEQHYIGPYQSGLCGEVQQDYLLYALSAPWGGNEILHTSEAMPNEMFYWNVPEGYVFLMGDNRDNSLDSRMVGPISQENIVGRAAFIYTSFDLCTDLPFPLPRPGRTLKKL